ncbi:MAG: hypothetical protein ACTSU5_13140 [Promethearchaeota archaeon]
MDKCIICGAPTSFKFEGSEPAEHSGKPMCPKCQATVHQTKFTGCSQGKCSIKTNLPGRENDD